VSWGYGFEGGCYFWAPIEGVEFVGVIVWIKLSILSCLGFLLGQGMCVGGRSLHGCLFCVNCILVLGIWFGP
jgi:hypothetical protein